MNDSKFYPESDYLSALQLEAEGDGRTAVFLGHAPKRIWLLVMRRNFWVP